MQPLFLDRSRTAIGQRASGTTRMPTRLTVDEYDGRTPFANLWPLALLSFGESWHNMHHSDPACGRHGADRGQVDISAAVIRIFERLGRATKVRWPTPARLDSRRRCPGRRENSRPETVCEFWHGIGDSCSAPPAHAAGTMGWAGPAAVSVRGQTLAAAP